MFTAAGMLIPVGLPGGITDHHQHLYSPEAGARSSPGPRGINARDLITHLDVAGIHRAVVLSVAYSFSNPHKPNVAGEYEHVMAENDWTSSQVAEFPNRPLGFCSVNRSGNMRSAKYYVVRKTRIYVVDSSSTSATPT